MYGPEFGEAVSAGLKKFYAENPKARKEIGKRKRQEAIQRYESMPLQRITHKRCTKCGKVKPVAEFSIRRDKLKCGLVRVRPEASCRRCCAERAKRNEEIRRVEGREDSVERKRRWRAKLTPAQKAVRRRKERERQAVKRREDGIPPRNFKNLPWSASEKARVPTEPASVLLEVLLETHTKKEIAAISGVDQRELRRIEVLEIPSIHIKQVDELLIAFGRQGELEDLYPLENPPLEKLVGYHILDPEGILDGK
jgi:hypothetical protein